MKVIKPIAESIGARQCASDSKLGKVSVIGTGMQNTPGFAARMFSALSRKGINIQLITTSEIRITCIIEETRVEEAVRILHQAFEIEESIINANPTLTEGLMKFDLKSDRRPLRVLVRDLHWEFLVDSELRLCFSLPAGSYATSLLREVVEVR